MSIQVIQNFELVTFPVNTAEPLSHRPPYSEDMDSMRRKLLSQLPFHVFLLFLYSEDNSSGTTEAVKEAKKYSHAQNGL